MRLIELRLKNLNSLKGEWHIDFADPAFINEGIFAITGQTGAGKTTILDAICLALYGETPRINSISKSSNEVMTRQTADCFAEVVIDLNGSHYRCRWGQRRAYGKSDGNLQDATHEIALVKAQTDDDKNDGDEILESKLSRTKDKIVELTRMDFQQFTRSILLAQGSFSAFLKAKADERADILEKITGTDIYATISTHVHEKKRSEEEILNKLQFGLDGLTLLTTDEEVAIKEELKSHQLVQTEQQQKYQQVSEQIQWVDAVTELRNKLSTYQSDLSIAENSKRDFIPDAKRLDSAIKALELETQFGQLNQSRDTTKRLQKEEQALAVKLPTQKATLEQALTQLKSADKNYEQFQLELENTLPKIIQTRGLDADIKQKKHSLNDERQRKEVLSTSVQLLIQEIKSHQIAASDNKSQLASTVEYLENHNELNDIDTDIATFNSSGRRLKVLLQENNSLADHKKDFLTQTKSYFLEMTNLSSQQQEHKSSVVETQKRYIALQEQQKQLLATESLADRRTEQQHIEQVASQIEQLTYNSHSLNPLITQIKNLQLSLPSISESLTTVTTSIADTEKNLKDAKDKRHEKQTQLALLQKVASLEDYISELETGQPCPLCGALEHPYANQTPNEKPSQILVVQQQIANSDLAIDGLENELSQHKIAFATTTNYLAQQQQQFVPLIAKANELADSIQDMSNIILANDDSYTSAMLASLKPINEISVLVDKLKQSLINDTLDVEITKSIAELLNQAKQQIAQHRDSVKNALTHYEALTDSMAKVEKQLVLFDKQQYQLASDISLLENDNKLTQQKLDDLEEKTKVNFVELQTLVADVLSVVTKYSTNNYLYQEIQLAADHEQKEPEVTITTQEVQRLRSSIDELKVLNELEIEQHLAPLRQQSAKLLDFKQRYNERKEQQQILQTECSRLTTQIETKQGQLDKELIELETATQSATQQTNAIAQLQNYRMEVFADKNVDEEEHRLRSGFEQAKTKQSSIQRQVDSAEQLVNIAEQQQIRLASDLTVAATALNNQDSIFKKALSTSDFTNEYAFVSARLSQEQRNNLNERQQQIDYSLKQATSLLQQTQQALADKQAKPLTLEDRAELLNKQQQAQAESNSLIAAIGAMSQQLKDNDAKKGNQQIQRQAIASQKESLQVWQQLHKLIGSADGKKYRTFAQGLTFDIMVNHANAKLHKMSDRYLLARDDNNPLELNVIDNYQGGEIRSTKNLSGGEGFIISLALALGLSQMASHNIRVDSLFLDEGFGTLDEESLDIALDTLTSLQQEGKLIGVISHVQALKERILTQIQVKKLSGGFSQISGQGCYHIAS